MFYLKRLHCTHTNNYYIIGWCVVRTLPPLHLMPKYGKHIHLLFVGIDCVLNCPSIVDDVNVHVL